MQRRLREAGRIRIGEQVPTSNGGTRPAKLDKFRFTSADKTAMLAIADLCGGEVVPWEGAPVGEQFELFGDCKCLDVLVPSVDLVFSQWMEQWSGGGCKKRCDGQTNVITDTPCSCDPDNMECKPTTRLGVILTAIQGIGIWRLETHGWNGATELSGTIEVVRVIQNMGATMVPARLLLEQRQSKRDGKTYNYAVPVLDLNVSVAALTGGIDRPRLAAGVTPIPQNQIAGPSVREQIESVAVASAPRANAAAPLPPTGIAPRPANAVTSDPIADARAEGEHHITAARAQDASATKPAAPAATTSDRTPGGASQKSVKRLFAMLNGNKGISKDRTERLNWASGVLGMTVESFDDLNQRAISMLNDAAEGKPASAAPTPPPRDDAPPPDDSSFAGYDDEPF